MRISSDTLIPVSCIYNVFRRRFENGGIPAMRWWDCVVGTFSHFDARRTSRVDHMSLHVSDHVPSNVPDSSFPARLFSRGTRPSFV